MTNHGEYVATGGKTVSREERILMRHCLLEEICENIKEGKEYQAVSAFQRYSDLGPSGILDDETAQGKYDMISVESLVLYVLSGHKGNFRVLEEIHTEFLREIHLAKTAEACRRAAETALHRYCCLKAESWALQYSPLVEKIITEVEEELTHSLTLQYFAEKLSVNSSYLSNLFRKEVGVTITEYVTGKRIAYAKKLLVVTTNPIKTVAKQAGIPDVQYFSKIFKRQTGITPSQYRQKHTSVN